LSYWEERSVKGKGVEEEEEDRLGAPRAFGKGWCVVWGVAEGRGVKPEQSREAVLVIYAVDMNSAVS
jgi:hypothetical protein